MVVASVPVAPTVNVCWPAEGPMYQVPRASPSASVCRSAVTESPAVPLVQVAAAPTTGPSSSVIRTTTSRACSSPAASSAGGRVVTARAGSSGPVPSPQPAARTASTNATDAGDWNIRNAASCMGSPVARYSFDDVANVSGCTGCG